MHKWMALIVSTAALTACGASTPLTATPEGGTPSESATKGKLRLGHFSSDDAAIGFVLDRTGATPKLRMDGTVAVVQLTREVETRGPFKVGTTYWSPDGHRVLHIDRYGWATFYSEDGPVSVFRDGDHAPLGAITVAGVYTPPKSDADNRAERYGAIAVRARMSGYQPEDSGDLAKLRVVIGKADPSMFVQFVGTSSRWVPASPRIGLSEHSLGVGKYPSTKKYDPHAKGILGFGGSIEQHTPLGERGHLSLVAADGFPKPLAQGTPGLVWEVDGRTAVFVTLDGGRYHIDLSDEDPFGAGLPPVAKWPKPLQHSLLDDEAIDYLAKANVLPTATKSSVLSHFVAYGDCTEAHWKTANEALDKLDVEMAAEQLTRSDRDARFRKLARQYRDSIGEACTSHAKALEAALLDQIDRRDRARLELYTAAKTRAKKLGR